MLNATVYTNWDNRKIGSVVSETLDGIKHHASLLCNQYNNAHDVFTVFYENNLCETFYRNNKHCADGRIERGYWSANGIS